MRITTSRVVWIALLINLIMFSTKGIIAWMSNSSALFSEALHSLADSTNSLLLLIGIHTALKPPDKRHPFGHGKSIYFWGLIAAIFMFGGTAVGGMIRGYLQLKSPIKISYIELAIIVLVFCLVMEFIAIYCASKSMLTSVEMNNGRNENLKGKFSFKRILKAFKESEELTVKLVFVEECAAFGSVAVALIAILTVGFTNFIFIDGYAGVGIGMLVAVLALYLANQYRIKLLMEAAPPRIEREIRKHATSTPFVRDVVSLKTMQVGADKILVHMVVELHPKMSVESVDDVTANLEKKIIENVPKVIDCFIEVVADEDLERTISEPKLHAHKKEGHR